jgi:nucleotide-binding universal stress UspA family protein
MAERIVVGIDGSPAARRALEWAVAEGAVRRCPVHAVTVWSADTLEAEPFWSAGATAHVERIRAAQREQVEAVESALPGTVHVECHVVEGHPVDRLVEAAEGADLLVLSSHGHGRMHQAIVGSVAAGCIRRASCPVLVVPAPQREHVHHRHHEPLRAPLP